MEPYDFAGCPTGYYTCAGGCDQDADCACDGLGGDAYDHAWRTPKCPEGYYECDGCCDRDADCACDDACDLGSHEDCSLAYPDTASKPHGWCPVGYHDCGQQHDCCDWNKDCKCDGAWRPGAGARPVALKQCLGLPKPLWHEVLELCGGECRELSRLVDRENQGDGGRRGVVSA